MFSRPTATWLKSVIICDSQFPLNQNIRKIGPELMPCSQFHPISQSLNDYSCPERANRGTKSKHKSLKCGTRVIYSLQRRRSPVWWRSVRSDDITAELFAAALPPTKLGAGHSRPDLQHLSLLPPAAGLQGWPGAAQIHRTFQAARPAGLLQSQSVGHTCLTSPADTSRQRSRREPVTGLRRHQWKISVSRDSQRILTTANEMCELTSCTGCPTVQTLITASVLSRP